MAASLRALLEDEAGATAIEYALLAGLIATVIVVSVAALGRTLDGLYGEANTELVTEMESSPK
jgi:pilus assembly protein Flp/PilA